MNTMIKIALFDENRYFSAGWQEALALHFSTYGKRTLLLDAQQVHEADLVFCYFPPGVQSCFCHFFEAQAAGRKTLYFSLRTPEGRHKRTVGTRCSLEAGVIYHDTPLVSALYQVSAELERRSKWPGRPGCGMNCVCQHRGLTLREQGDHALHDAGDGGDANCTDAGHQRENRQQSQDERYAQDGIPA